MRKINSESCRLLDKVCYLSRRPEQAKTLLGTEVLVQDTFAYNPESKTSPKTAMDWATNYWYNRNNQEHINYVPVVETRENLPFTVKITDIEARAEGGRAYKVVDALNRRFDLREDQVVDVIKLRGITQGGEIPGEFVWGILNSTVRMVLVGGELHTEMVENAQKSRIQF